MLGDVNKSRDSCSDSFFLRRSMTFEPLLALWNHRGETVDCVCVANLALITFLLSFCTDFCETVRIHATFSLWISLRRCEILTFMASSSSSGTWGMVSGSVSSGLWKVSSVRGMYHLLSYCWFLLQWYVERTQREREKGEGIDGKLWVSPEGCEGGMKEWVDL